VQYAQPRGVWLHARVRISQVNRFTDSCRTKTRKKARGGGTRARVMREGEEEEVEVGWRAGEEVVGEGRAHPCHGPGRPGLAGAAQGPRGSLRNAVMLPDHLNK
jgi:hypothetical protein